MTAAAFFEKKSSRKKGDREDQCLRFLRKEEVKSESNFLFWGKALETRRE